MQGRFWCFVLSDQLRKFKAILISSSPASSGRNSWACRVIMEDGVSLANADAIFSVLDADIVVSGKVIDYQDYQGFSGKPKVDFSTIVIERKSREVVWGSNSYNEGDDGVFFFDTGRVNTAYVMASQMVRWIGEKVLGDRQRVQGGKRNGKIRERNRMKKLIRSRFFWRSLFSSGPWGLPRARICRS